MEISEFRGQLRKNYQSYEQASIDVLKGKRVYIETLDIFITAARSFSFSDDKICTSYSYVPLGRIFLTSGFYVRKNSPLKEQLNEK